MFAIKGKPLTTGPRSLIRMIDSPGILSSKDIWRVTFSGIELAQTCQGAGGIFGSSVKFTAANFSGTYDLVAAQVQAQACLFEYSLISPVDTYGFKFWLNGTCSGSPETPTNFTTQVTWQPHNRNLSVRLGSQTASGGFSTVIFDSGGGLPCNYSQGMVFLNAQTVFIPTNQTGKNGSATLTRLCP